MIKDNLSHLWDDISSVCKQLGRNPGSIVLVGVTKYADSSQIKEAIEAGLTHVGENKVQEAQRKFPVLHQVAVPVTKHMIGHLQTNKVKRALELFDLIQSVDSYKLAEAIDQQAQKLNRRVDILIQVNTSGEGQKHGIQPSQGESFFQEILALEHIRVLGLMTIAPFIDNRGVIRQTFRNLKILFDRLNNQYPPSDKAEMKYLSMGMTNDYRIALEEGANMLRIGRAIFHHE